MTRILQRILFGIALGLAGIDILWAAFGHFQIDANAYLLLALLAGFLFGLGLYYDRRRDPRLGAMLLGTSFLCAFSAAASILNYFLLLHTGARIDWQLAGLDRAMGVDWIGMMRFMAAHPLLNRTLLVAYGLLLPQIALLIPVLAWSQPGEEVYRFCLALAAGALITIGLWTFAPSFGAFSVYHLPAGMKFDLALDENYARALVALLRDGPGFITPRNIRGLIGFPSYHAVLALLVVRYAWPVAWLRWPALTLNALILAATPIQGGHHVIDVLAAIPVTGLALGVVRAAEFLKPAYSAAMANNFSKITTAHGSNAHFRTGSARSVVLAPPAINSTLSHRP